MKRILRLEILIWVIFTSLFTIQAQVGINTTSPAAGSMLDIESTDKGMLVPRVDIADLNTIAPVTGGSTESLLVYNTNTTTGKGFYYWDGSQWVSIGIDNDDWNILGNTGTNQSVNFIGTTDSQGLTVRTNNTERFRFNTNNQLLAIGNGSAAAPSYSWGNDTTMGFYKSGTSQMDMVINGVSFYNANANIAPSENEWTFNPGGLDSNLRVETDNNANALFVDGANDNVGFGTNAPVPSAQLEMADINKGLLVNRVLLTATNSSAPITAPATGLLVFNTATAGSGATAVTPGFYFWDGSKWVGLDNTNGRDWSLLGNAGTNSATNFIGTTDNVSLSFKTNNTERMLIDAAGTVGIGNTPYTDTALRVNNAAQPYGVIAQTSSNGMAVYGSDTGTGIGVFGVSTNNHGVYGTTDYTGGAYLIGGIIGWGTGSSRANGVLAVSDKIAGSDSNIGIRAVSGSTTSISSNQVLNIGVNTNATDLALYAISEGPITSTGTIEAARFQTNYTGSNIDPDSRDPRAQLAGYTNSSEVGGNTMYYGGYFYSGGTSGTASYAYAGARYGNTNYKIIGNGNVSTIVDGVDGNKKIMFAPEAPEVLFEDYGTGKLNQGEAYIKIDPNFSNNILVDQKHPLKVFVQLEGACNGVYITQKTAEGFLVKEQQNGTSNVSFSWHIVANRKDEIGTRQTETNEYANLRFPNAPKALQISKNKAVIIKKQDDKLLRND